MSVNEISKWRDARRTFLLFLALGMVVGGVIGWYRWEVAGAIVFESALLCLALGVWITERLIGVFTRVQRASGTAEIGRAHV